MSEETVVSRLTSLINENKVFHSSAPVDTRGDPYDGDGDFGSGGVSTTAPVGSTSEYMQFPFLPDHSTGKNIHEVPCEDVRGVMAKLCPMNFPNVADRKGVVKSLGESMIDVTSLPDSLQQDMVQESTQVVQEPKEGTDGSSNHVSITASMEDKTGMTFDDRHTARNTMWTYGVYNGGPDLVGEAWQSCQRRFVIDNHYVQAQFPQWTTDNCKHRDDLVPWLDWLHDLPEKARPKALVGVWPEWVFNVGPEQGPMGKPTRKCLEHYGYSMTYHYVPVHRTGGVIDTGYMVGIGLHLGYASRMMGQDLDLTEFLSDLPHRPMFNCLRPFGAGSSQRTIPEGMTTEEIPSASRDLMPSKCGSWIKTTAGYRRLHLDELANGLGFPRGWVTSETITLGKRRQVARVAPVHLWELVGRALASCLSPPVSSDDQSSAPSTSEDDNGPPHESPHEPLLTSDDSGEKWTWTVPNLAPNKAWWRRRYGNLRQAVRTYPLEMQAELLKEGKADLDRHRDNYGPDGVQRIQLLWWGIP